MNVEKIVNEILKVAPINNMSTRIICIDGRGGAGKSTYAKHLSSLLGDCSIVHTDDFASLEEPISWYKRMLKQVLIPIGKNLKSIYQKYDWDKRQLSEWLTITPQKYLLIEGVSSCRNEFRPYISYAIFIETNKKLCLARGLKRDGEHMQGQWLKWMSEEESYIKEHAPQEFANVIVSGGF